MKNVIIAILFMALILPISANAQIQHNTTNSTTSSTIQAIEPPKVSLDPDTVIIVEFLVAIAVILLVIGWLKRQNREPVEFTLERRGF